MEAKTEPLTVNTARPIYEIAQEIYQKWPKVNYGAKPYLEAMLTMNQLTEKFGVESCSDILDRFLVNAATWRGEDARRIKAELKKMAALAFKLNYGDASR